MHAALISLYLPRRHRRPLLFPPGMLALAGLLWLGSLALSAHPEQLRRRNVMQLTMMPLRLSPKTDPWFFTKGSPFALSPVQFERFRPWKTSYFVGSPDADAREQAWLAATAHRLQRETGRHGGLRIRFAPTARYAQLVFALNLMNRENIRKYWLDTRHRPTTLYALTYGNQPSDLTEEDAPPPTTPPLGPRLAEWAGTICSLHWVAAAVAPAVWQPLLSPDWAASTALLGLMAGLSIWRRRRR